MYYQIPEFFGIQQQKDGSLLPAGTARDARNIDTRDGNLRVANGYEKHISAAVPSTDRILKLMIARGTTIKFYVVTANNIYVFDNDEWTSIYTFAQAISGQQVDYFQTQIGMDDCLVVATGHQQMVKIIISSDTASLFGTGLHSFDGTVSSYDSTTRVVTLSASLSAEALRHAPLDGITIDGTLLEVASASGSTVTLKKEPTTAPSASNTATIRGGGSDASCNYIDMYYGRMVSAGDPNAPCRLYWSAAIGSGRTIEDWLVVTASAEASGGYVDVGDASGDSIVGLCVLSTQLLIFKKYSVYRMYGDRPSTFAVERVENFAQSMSNASVVIKYDTPHWFTRDGIYYYDGTGVLPMNDGQRIIGRFLESLNSVAASKGAHANNMLYFTVKVSPDSIYDDAIVQYDVGRASFMIRNGFQIADLAANDGHLYLINGARYVYEFNKGTSYDGANIIAYWNSQATDLGAKYTKKQIREILFRGTTGRVLFTVRSGDMKSYVQKNLFADNDGFVSVSISADMSRVWEIRIENEAGSSFEICGGIDVGFDKEKSAK